jgi:hypothetical protein
MFEEGLSYGCAFKRTEFESKPNYPLLFLIMLSQMYQKELGFQGLIFTDKYESGK